MVRSSFGDFPASLRVAAPVLALMRVPAFLRVLALVAPLLLWSASVGAQQQALFRSNVSSTPVTALNGVAYEAYAGQWRNGVPMGQVAAEQLEIFQNLPFTGWLKADNHRAFAIGTPASCPYSWRSTGYPSPELAVEEALRYCTEKVLRFNQHQTDQCGCKIAMVNNQLFVDPAELSVPRIAPALWDFGNGSMVAGLLIYERIFGRNNPVQFVDSGGQLRCQGTYSASAVLIDNNFKINCDFASGVLKGKVGVKNLQSFNPHGEALVKDDNGQQIRLVVAKSILDYLEGK